MQKGRVRGADTVVFATYLPHLLVCTPQNAPRYLRGSLPKSGPLDFATKNTFALFFVGEEALVGVY